MSLCKYGQFLLNSPKLGKKALQQSTGYLYINMDLRNWKDCNMDEKLLHTV